jgi:hypothetical protein
MFHDPFINDEGFFQKPQIYYDPNQLRIEYFWPLTEQIGLDLDYNGCDTRQSSGLTVSSGTGITFANPTWTTTVAPTLSVSPTDAVGTLSIGGVNVGLEAKPKWYQKALFKILGFNWKDK